MHSLKRLSLNIIAVRHTKFEAFRVDPILALFRFPANRRPESRTTLLYSSQGESNTPVSAIQICAGWTLPQRSIGIHYRALGVPVSEGVQWFWIGPHTEYDKFFG